MYHKILVPLDGSEFAEQALPHAEQIAQATHGEIHLLSVAPLLEDQALAAVDLYPIYVYRSYLVDQEHEIQRVQEELQAYLDTVAQRMKAKGFTVVVSVRFGQPADEIIAYTEKAGCDLITMSTHGRSGMGRWVYGSIADKVLRGSKVPVLLVRARQGKK